MMITVSPDIPSQKNSGKLPAQSLPASPAGLGAMSASAANADTWNSTIIPAGTGTAPSVRLYAKKSGLINAGRKSLTPLTSMWCLRSRTNSTL